MRERLMRRHQRARSRARASRKRKRLAEAVEHA